MAEKQVDPPGQERIATILQPYLGDTRLTPLALEQFGEYLRLLLKWNARTNLTAIRDPEEIVARHFGESLFAARFLGASETLLDFGSGAGFPGFPLQIARPDLRVTLAESQGKKASFLREVIRTLNLATQVWGERVETMPEGTAFDTLALRAVDGMDGAVEAGARVARERLLLFGVRSGGPTSGVARDFELIERVSIPDSAERCLFVYLRRR